MDSENLEQETSEELVSRVKRKGCSRKVWEECFRIVATRFRERLLRNAYRRLHDRDDAEEAVSQTWEGFLDGLAGYDPNQTPVSAWLHRILRNKCCRMHRDWKREQTDEDKVDCSLVVCTARRRDPMLRRVLAMRVWRYVDALPARLRIPFVGHYIEGRTYAELARLLGLTVRTVEYRAATALRLVRSNARPQATELGL